MRKIHNFCGFDSLISFFALVAKKEYSSLRKFISNITRQLPTALLFANDSWIPTSSWKLGADNFPKRSMYRLQFLISKNDNQLNSLFNFSIFALAFQPRLFCTQICQYFSFRAEGMMRKILDIWGVSQMRICIEGETK
ncbi:hypothetical protein J2S36_000716 [Arcanobacterium hippocoleae]|uniref:Uncharacterized protein n=1 Tax=Arcanobacterium hippocoleae TaxID=149017 RepID=A0ABU1T1C5_9ACTO|nr:hypothetical protein [Arcanobacterium hippocoleae]